MVHNRTLAPQEGLCLGYPDPLTSNVHFRPPKRRPGRPKAPFRAPPGRPRFGAQDDRQHLWGQPRPSPSDTCMDTFLSACAQRRTDGTLHRAILSHLIPSKDSERWRIELRPGRGRILVAALDLPAGSLVFSERPLVVATAATTGDAALRGEAQAVALALLQQRQEGAFLLCSPSLGEG